MKISNLFCKSSQIIVSFTSYPARFRYVPFVVNSILKNTLKPWKICLCVYKEDIKYLTDEINNFINNNIIELIIAEENLRPHCKYFYTMKKYRNHPIITIDDDSVYSSDLIESLYESYKKYPNCVSARRVDKLKCTETGEFDLYVYTQYEYKQITYPSHDLVAEGVGGVLYPPNILKINNKCLPYIKKYISVDDLYLYYLELKKGIKVVYVPNNNNLPIIIEGTQRTAMCMHENKIDALKTTTNDIIITELINPYILKQNKIKYGRKN